MFGCVSRVPEFIWIINPSCILSSASAKYFLSRRKKGDNFFQSRSPLNSLSSVAIGPNRGEIWISRIYYALSSPPKELQILRPEISNVYHSPFKRLSRYITANVRVLSRNKIQPSVTEPLVVTCYETRGNLLSSFHKGTWVIKSSTSLLSLVGHLPRTRFQAPLSGEAKWQRGDSVGARATSSNIRHRLTSSEKVVMARKGIRFESVITVSNQRAVLISVPLGSNCRKV